MTELLVAMAILGLMSALAVAGYRSWARSSSHLGTAREVQVTMRQAHQQAITEGRSTCVWFDVEADTYALYRGTCESATKQRLSGPNRPNADGIELSAPEFIGPSGTSTGVTFYARGTATAGRVKVVRPGSTKEYVLKVEGLTGRVSLA